MSLVDELTQKQAKKIQLNKINRVFIDKALSENNEGILNLLYKITKKDATRIRNYIRDTYPDYESAVVFTGANYEIPFRRRLSEVKN